MKEKLFLLLQTTDGGADIRVGSINIYYGIRKKKDAEKHFAAEHYISTLENYQKRYERACKYENEPARKEVLADILELAVEVEVLDILQVQAAQVVLVRLVAVGQAEALTEADPQEAGKYEK